MSPRFRTFQNSRLGLCLLRMSKIQKKLRNQGQAIINIVSEQLSLYPVLQDETPTHTYPHMSLEQTEIRKAYLR